MEGVRSDRLLTLQRLERLSELLHPLREEVEGDVPPRLVAAVLPELLEDRPHLLVDDDHFRVGRSRGLLLGHLAEGSFQRVELIVEIIEGSIIALAAASRLGA